MSPRGTFGRRTFLKKSATASGIAGGVLIGTAGTASAARTRLTLDEKDGQQVRYYISVTGDMRAEYSVDGGDEVGSSYCNGAVRGGKDVYSFSGQISYISVGGNGDLVVDPNGGFGYDGKSWLRIYNDGGFQSYVRFEVTGNVSGTGDGSIEQNDTIGSNYGISRVNGGTDRFNTTGRLSHLRMRPNSGNETFYFDRNIGNWY